MQASASEFRKRYTDAAYSKPMCEWTKMAAQNIASMSGFSEPAANGAIVRGMRPADTILHPQSVLPSQLHSVGIIAPLKRPVVAAMCGCRVRDGHRVIGCSHDALR